MPAGTPTTTTTMRMMAKTRYCLYSSLIQIMRVSNQIGARSAPVTEDSGIAENDSVCADGEALKTTEEPVVSMS